MERAISQVEFKYDFGFKKINVAAYARVSSDKDAMLHSLLQQREYYENLITNNYSWNYVNVYVDEGITGTKTNRPQFTKMIEDAKKGKIDLIVTKSISRFARNTLTLLNTVRELKELNVDIYFEEENIHTLQSEGELLLSILASKAEEESRSVSENMRWRIKKNFSEGLSWGTHLYGYEYKNNEYKVIPQEAIVVRRIFDLFLSGNGVNKISKTLTELGYFNRNNKPFPPSTIRKMLLNEYYTGNKLLQKTYRKDYLSKKKELNKGLLPQYYVEESHEAIISNDEYLAVKELFMLKANKYAKKCKNAVKSPLKGLVACSCCNSFYRRKKVHNKYIWICGKVLDKGASSCNSKQVPEDKLLDATSSIIGSVEADDIKDEINKIYVCENHILRFELKDGTTKEIEWKYDKRKGIKLNG